MATPVFPTELPKCMADGYAINRAQEFVRGEFETGPARQRRVFTGSRGTMQVGWQLTGAQVLTFRNFYDNTISAGARAFTLSLWLGTSFTDMVVRFKTAPTESKKAPFSWEVKGEIELLQSLPTS